MIAGDLYNDTGDVTAPTITLNTSTFSNNSSNLYGALKLQYNSTMTCTANASDSAGFFNNSSTQDIGAVFVMDGSTFHSQSCDFGVGSTDNTPIDLSLGKSQGYDDYTYGDNETFSCTAEVCSP